MQGQPWITNLGLVRGGNDQDWKWEVVLSISKSDIRLESNSSSAKMVGMWKILVLKAPTF